MKNPLVPSVQRRITAWKEIQSSNQAAHTQVTAPTITLAREFGCEAYPLAEALKEALDKTSGAEWTIFDHALIDKIIEEEELSQAALRSLGDRNSFLDSLISSLTSNWKTDADQFQSIVKTIYALAGEGRAIIVGRGAAVICKNLSNCLNIRLEAPKEFRVKSLMRRLDYTEEAALQLLEEKQASRDAFLNHLLDCDITQSQHYHAVLNNSKLSIPQMVKVITTLLPKE